MRILIVDDDPDYRAQLAELLTDSGYAVSLAGSGEEALRTLDAEGVDVVLLDLAMPTMTGFDVLREGRRAHPDAAFIMVTGHGTVDTAVEAVKAGATDFVLKPFEYEALEQMLRTYDRAHAIEATRVRAAFLTYSDGTLIGSSTAPGETAVDHDLLGATMNVIQDFMRRSFPILKGRPLRSIVQGDRVLLLEGGEHVLLTTIVAGPEDAVLRKRMRHAVDRFEATNGKLLRQWKGSPDDVEGLDALFAELFQAPAPSGTTGK